MLFQAIFVLVRARIQIYRNSFWRGRLIGKLGLMALGGLLVGGSFAIYRVTRFVVELMRSPELLELLREAAARNPTLPTDPAPLLAALPSAVLLAALALLVFSSFSSLLSSLFLSGDMDLLLVAPVPMRAVFVVKFFGGLLPQYLILLALLGPVLIGYGQGMGYGLLYQLCAVLTLLLIPLLPAGIGALLVMAVVRVLPPRRAREILSVLGGLLGVSFYLLTQLSPQIAPRVDGADSLGALLAADLPLLPSAWAGRALVAAGEGDTLSLLSYGGLFLVSSVGMFVICLLLSERLYYAGWSNLAAEGSSVRKRTTDDRRPTTDQHRAPRFGGLAALLPQQSRAILVKDLRLFRRDLRNLQALIFPLALTGIWTYQIFSGTSGAPESPDLPIWATQFQELAGVGIAFFICLSLSSVLAGTGVSREGKAFWLLKLAPIAPWRLLLGKLTLAFLPFPLVGTLFLVLLGLVRGLGPLVLLQQWLMLLLAGLGCAAFGMGLGAAFPKLNWENPAQQTSWQSGCLGTLFYPLFLALLLALVAGGAVAGELLGGTAGVGVRLVGWTLAVGLTAAVVWLGIVIGTRGLERIEL